MTRVDPWATMETQMTFDTTYYPLVAVSCVFFLCAFKYVSPPVCAYLFPKIHSLPEAKQSYWHSSMTSSLHAVITSCLCLTALIFEEGLRTNPVWHDSVLVKSSCAVVFGYLTADTILMAVYYQHIGDIFSLMHHATSMYAYYFVMTYGVFVYFANLRLMAEFSTPFVNNRWFLDVYGCDKTGQVYIWNGTILTAVFFLCRIVTMPYCWYKIYCLHNTVEYVAAGNVRFVLILACIMLDSLNLKWFFKLLKGVHKTLQKKMDANKNITKAKAEKSL